MNSTLLSHGSELAAILLLLSPMAHMTMLSDVRQWWHVSSIGLLPFSQSAWTVRSTLGVWYGLFWCIALYAVTSLTRSGSALRFVLIVAGIEGAYELLGLWKGPQPLPTSSPDWLIAFALMHNAVMEEVVFRGLPYAAGGIVGLGAWMFWPHTFVAISAITFGLYHARPGRRSRLYDTTCLGAALALVVLEFGIAPAILLHCIHNARALPIGHSLQSFPRWRLNRRLHLTGLLMCGLWGLFP